MTENERKIKALELENKKLRKNLTNLEVRFNATMHENRSTHHKAIKIEKHFK
jgi:regulator of replication initiation timing